jgi:hypothetical protein
MILLLFDFQFKIFDDTFLLLDLILLILIPCIKPTNLTFKIQFFCCKFSDFII